MMNAGAGGFQKARELINLACFHVSECNHYTAAAQLREAVQILDELRQHLEDEHE